VRNRLTRTRGWVWKLAIPVAAVAVAAQLALAGSASATHTMVLGHHAAGTILPAKVNDMDCNSWSKKYGAAAPAIKMKCTDPLGPLYNGHRQRFYDNGHYVGHDEPSVKFISSLKGSGNTMNYAFRVPKDPAKAPTANGSVADYSELSVAPWYGLAMCDGHSYPQNPCKPDSDSNLGSISNPADAGSAFMEMQFYPPGNSTLIDGASCSKTQWCAALNIDSLECTFNFASCNTGCEEPVNFALIQTNGVPAGPPAPQDPNAATFLGNAKTLKMNPGDVVTVAFTDPSSGFTVKIDDLTTHQSGFMQASAKNGFTDTNMADCSGNPFTWHAEYSTAKIQNQTPWAALEGGVLMQQEVGHGEPCTSLANKDGDSVSYQGGKSTYVDPNVFQNCVGGLEGSKAKGEGPCNPTTGTCKGGMTEGTTGPVACTTTTSHCENSDGFCLPKGTRTVMVNGKAVKESSRLNFCYQNQFENGDVDYDGSTYVADWPNGSANFPQSFEYWGPFSNGHAYPNVQSETDGPASEQLCNITTGVNCVEPPVGAPGKFYPFWSLTNKEVLKGVTGAGACLWNFGNDIKGVTTNDFGKDKQYGKPDIARFGGTTISKVLPNPALATPCKPVK
jgi:hypothetical protein